LWSVSLLIGGSEGVRLRGIRDFRGVRELSDFFERNRDLIDGFNRLVSSPDNQRIENARLLCTVVLCVREVLTWADGEKKFQEMYEADQRRPFEEAEQLRKDKERNVHWLQKMGDLMDRFLVVTEAGRVCSVKEFRCSSDGTPLLEDFLVENFGRRGFACSTEQNLRDAMLRELSASNTSWQAICRKCHGWSSPLRFILKS
jgi:hypothetical protein